MLPYIKVCTNKKPIFENKASKKNKNFNQLSRELNPNQRCLVQCNR
jgi:hypothetical protein